MPFAAFLQQSWANHASHPEGVLFSEGSSLIESADQVAALARLVVHVAGEHLGRWTEGASQIEALKALPQANDPVAASALERASAVFAACERGVLPEGLQLVDRARVLITASAALSAQRFGERAELFFRQAMRLSAKGLEIPAHKEIAMASNNLAVGLEDRPELSFREKELMLMAAHAARKHWEIAGGWLEVERAEYRLAMSFLAAGKPRDARRHAELCLEICAANQAEPIEWFYGLEALALSFHREGDREGFLRAKRQAEARREAVPLEERAYIESSWAKLQDLG